MTTIKPLSLRLALALSLVAAFSTAAQPAASDGQDVLTKFLEVNKYWLVTPPPTVQNFSYVLQRPGKTQPFQVSTPQKTPRARLQGVTYSALIHHLARNPQSATVTNLSRENGRIRLELTLNPPVRGACGNGVENSWTGYYSLGGESGFLVLDSERFFPLEAGIGRLHETFGEFVALDPDHYVPLAIRILIGGDTEFNWRFRVYQPGLWLFDECHSGGRRLAWIEQVTVNSAGATLQHATEASLARAVSEQTGQARLREFLTANRHWLLPSLQTRRGLAYAYRQEPPYLERIIFDQEGNLFAQLSASKDSPDQPTRQRLWLPDGRSATGNAADRFLSLAPKPETVANPEYPWPGDRLPQHLALGLALDCALTRLAREPDTFWAEVQRVPESPDKYRLVLHAKKEARLFTGTMLAFTSWAFMHDVEFDRAEILCDAATHRPLEEKDFDGPSQLKGHYFFENWMGGPDAAVPGRIRAVVPYTKNDQDQSLEMHARFQSREGLWLLDQVESWFSGGGGSTGTVTVIPPAEVDYQPIRELLQKAELTEQILTAIAGADEKGAEIRLSSDQWSAAPVKAAWTDQARQSLERENRAGTNLPSIGIHRARLLQNPGNKPAIEFEGISTATWKEYRTEWKLTVRDHTGASTASVSTNLVVRAENAPTPFSVRLGLPAGAQAPVHLSLQGSVQRMTAGYHGHGIWFQLTEP